MNRPNLRAAPRSKSSWGARAGRGKGFYPRSSNAHGYAFYPCAIDDPRGRDAGRASPVAAARPMPLCSPVWPNEHCALRAPTMFSVRMKSASVRKTRLLGKAKAAAVFSSKIATCARMCFSSVRNRRSARTGRRPRKPDRCSLTQAPAPIYKVYPPIRTFRARAVLPCR